MCRLHDRVAQLRRPGGRRVLGEIRVDGGDGSIFDVLRRGKMRLSHAQVDHVHTLLAQLVGFGHHRHGGGGLDAVDAFRELHCGGCFGDWSHALFPAFGFLASFSLTAGSSFSLSLRSTISGTRSLMEPPSCATSRTSRELK